MRKDRRSLIIAIALVGASALMYVLHFVAFRDAKNLAFYTFMDIAFMPVDLLIVTVIVNGVLAARERQAMLDKLNMVIGAFFSEVGTELVGAMMEFDESFDEIRAHLTFSPKWTAEDYVRAKAEISAHEHRLDFEAGDAEGLRTLLTARRDFLLRLLENPNLLEHESFTSLLWSVFHLTEELGARADLGELPEGDRLHLAGDIARAYTMLLCQWLDYVRHLQTSYPYLFSFAVRTNPFDPDARIEAA